MSTDWADDIVLANLADEPALSDELGTILERLEAIGEPERLPHLVLDFSGVTYINSSNIAQLLRLRQALEPAGRHLRLVAVEGDVLSFSPDTLTALASVQIDHEG
jgi:MFS superfamily sulfate permease-like transporter